MLRLSILAAAMVFAASDVPAQETSTRAGSRRILPREREIELARSAAPHSVSAHARVLVLIDSAYVMADSGGGEQSVTCVVNRSWRESIEPQCYDREAAATIMPMELRRNELRHRSTPEAEIDRQIAAGLASGQFRLPSRPAMTYMMSSQQLLYDDDGRRVGSWRPHLMIYYPYLTNAQLGLASSPDMSVGMVSQEGTPEATLMLVMPAFATASGTATK